MGKRAVINFICNIHGGEKERKKGDIRIEECFILSSKETINMGMLVRFLTNFNQLLC